jgi:hypothetical protein
LLTAGIKPIENRTWPTRYRGPLLIHASKLMFGYDISKAEDIIGVTIPRSALATSAIVGIATIVEIIEHSKSPWFSGPYGWRFDEPRQFKQPIPCRGQQSLWTPPPDVLALLINEMES